MARYVVEHDYIQMIGPIWEPGFDCCAMDKMLSGYDVRNIEEIAKDLFDSDVITREAIEHWLSLNSGDFQHVTDFYASVGDQDFPWADEESEFAYCDCMLDARSDDFPHDWRTVMKQLNLPDNVIPFPLEAQKVRSAREYWRDLLRCDQAEYEGRKFRPNRRIIHEYFSVVVGVRFPPYTGER
jgi:hypothetical protein